MASEVVSKQTWMSFVQEGSLDERKLSNEIIGSWQLCRQHKVNPFDGVGCKILDQDQLDKKIKENQLLVNLTKQNINPLRRFLNGWRYVTTLTDRDGCILFKTGENKVEQAAEEIFFKEGAKWDEPEVGTNAIGLAKRLKKAITVKGYEHFAVASQKWNCFASPILDQDNELLGVLNISSLSLPINYHYVLSSVQLAADTISLDWKKKIQGDIEYLMRCNFKSENPSIICTTNKIICSLPKELPSRYNRFLGLPLHNLTEEIHLSEVFIPIMNENRIIGYRIPLKIEKSKIKTMTLSFKGVRGTSLNYQHVLDEVEKVAPTNAAVHIFGETGTGKEVIAEAIHANSHRAAGPFIKLNCGAIPEQLLESELFGYESGAFTGANNKGYKGKFEQADGGTLFLDEIGDMPQSMQVALLRVLQQKELTRLGGTNVKKVDVRIITAANLDIRDLVKQGKMRQDLFFRIYIYPITIPPLRERKEDIKSLIENYYQRKDWYPSWHRRLETIFMKGEWRGNIRELHNALERCEILYSNQAPTDEELYQLISSLEIIIPDPSCPQVYDFKDKIEIKEIEKALTKHRGHVSKAAKELNISRATLYRKMKKYQI